MKFFASGLIVVKFKVNNYEIIFTIVGYSQLVIEKLRQA